MSFRNKIKKTSLLFSGLLLLLSYQNCSPMGFGSSGGLSQSTNSSASTGSGSGTSGNPGTTGNLKSLTLAWDPNTDATLAGYRIYYGTSSQN